MIPWDGCKAKQIASSPRTEDSMGCQRCESACPTSLESVLLYGMKQKLAAWEMGDWNFRLGIDNTLLVNYIPFALLCTLLLAWPVTRNKRLFYFLITHKSRQEIPPSHPFPK
ncbi:unnamed protein product [Musa acuminata subsp. malaccensis]|uniref:4Fe-4S ferredoxin-type domain-containing protein n=1 Tax=Musa acuminata subsp. malaccensis TaxID=214687 RepID=A0A804U649_MUSAM|nr:unnamed protein product [Musa acuminata subsp. malaccensis]